MKSRIITILFIGLLAIPAYAAALTVKSVDFMNIESKSRIQIGLDDKATYDVSRQGNVVLLKIENAKINNELLRPFITREFNTAIEQIMPKQAGDSVVFEISMKQMAPYFISQDKNELLMDFDIPAELMNASDKKITLAQGADVQESYAMEGAVEDADAAQKTEKTEKSVADVKKTSKNLKKISVEESKTPDVIPLMSKYKGSSISLDFQGADIHNVIRIIADVSGLNIVTSDDVKGKVTIKLKDVPWDEALDVVLESKDLGKLDLGNVVRIAPADKIKAAQERMIASQKTQEQLEPLVTSVIPLSFASVKSVMDLIQKKGGGDKGSAGVLTERASVIGDERTNTLYVKDIRRSIDEFNAMIKRLDRPTPQVMIQARIVQADTNYEQGLGVSWGGAYENTSNSNSFGLYGAGVPSTSASSVIATGTSGTGKTWSTDSLMATPAMAVAFPVSSPSSGGIGVTIGRIAGTILDLDMQLQAGETNGKVNVLARPRVVTLDNKKATIKQGMKYPYIERNTDGELSTVLKDIELVLEVTPRISFDGSVNMEISVKRNAVNTGIQNSLGDPAITSREAQTELLVKDGDTTVIGGIIEESVDFSEEKVPLLGDLPIIGWLFKGQHTLETDSELLLFISPQVIRAGL